MRLLTTNAGRACRHHRQRGFSLLELLVAFAIMAMSLGLLYRVAGGNARQVSDLTMQQKAIWLATSVLASRNSVKAEGWNETGGSAGFKWEVRSEPFPGGVNGAEAIPLHQIHLSIFWTSASSPSHIDLVTLMPERKSLPGEVTP